MTQTRFSLLTAIALASFTQIGLADSVTLKSGEKIEGRVLEETATQVTLEVRSGGITDSRVIGKDEVASVEKASPDELPWQTLKGLKLTANSMPAASYEATVRALKAFISQFPTSAHLADAQKTLATFEEEKARVDGGEAKFNDHWLSKEEVQKERYQINGLTAFNYMSAQASGGDLVGALNTFDVLEKQFPGARIYPDAVELARRLVVTLKGEVDRRTPVVTAEVAERAKGIQLASVTQRVEMEAALKKETAALDAALEAATKKGLKWTPMLPHSLKSLQAITARLSGETSRINSLDVGKMRESLKLSAGVQKQIAEGELAGASEALSKAKSLWSANELATRLQGDLTLAKAAPPKPVEVAATAPAGATEVNAPGVKPTASGAKSAGAAADAKEPEKSFLFTPGGAITAVVGLIFLGVAFSAYRKLKGRANEVLE